MGCWVNLTCVDKYIFVAVKIVLVCLAYLSFHMVLGVRGE